MASRRSLPSVVADIRARAVRYGRKPSDLLFFQALAPIVGGTEAEARAKADEYSEQLSIESGLAHLSGMVGTDLSVVDPDRPLDDLQTNAVQSIVKDLLDSAPPRTRTFRDLVRANMTGQFTVGTPEQIADRLASWAEAGADGFNLIYSVTPGSFGDFIDGVVPVLRARGLVRTDYEPGALRQKLTGSPRLPDRHPAAAYRHRPGPVGTTVAASPRTI